jgi:hypothetical protein
VCVYIGKHQPHQHARAAGGEPVGEPAGRPARRQQEARAPDPGEPGGAGGPGARHEKGDEAQRRGDGGRGGDGQLGRPDGAGGGRRRAAGGCPGTTLVHIKCCRKIERVSEPTIFFSGQTYSGCTYIAYTNLETYLAQKWRMADC